MHISAPNGTSPRPSSRGPRPLVWPSWIRCSQCQPAFPAASLPRTLPMLLIMKSDDINQYQLDSGIQPTHGVGWRGEEEGGRGTGDTCHSSLLDSRIWGASSTSFVLPPGILPPIPSTDSRPCPLHRHPSHAHTICPSPNAPRPPLRRKGTSRGMSPRWCQGRGAGRHWRCQAAAAEV